MNRTYRIVLIPMMGTPQVMSEVARTPGAVLDGGVDSSKSRLTLHLLAMAIGVALASAACPLPAQICTPSATTICGANGGNASGSAGGAGGVTSGNYANGGGSGGSGGPGSVGAAGSGSGGGAGGGSSGITGPSGPVGDGSSGGGPNGATLAGTGGGGGGISSHGYGAGGGGGGYLNAGGGGGGGGGSVGQTVAATTFVNPGVMMGGVGGGGAAGVGDAGGGGGGGGAGGAGIYATTGSSLVSGTGSIISGGAGGTGGAGRYLGGGGGGGGAGVAGTGFTLNAGGTINGGAGGNGGANLLAGSGGGGGGGGGAGVTGSGFQLANTGTIRGGAGGTVGAVGSGGIGVISTGGSTISNSGTIAGGLSGDGTQAEAIALSGGGNQLVMEAGATFIGTVISRSGTTNGGDTFTLGGSSNASFDLAMLGAAIQGFERLAKAGTSTWTLTGTGNAAQAWTIADGTLTVDTTSLIGNVTFAPASGGNPDLTFNQATNGVYNGTINGAGTLTKTGTGTLTLTGNHAYTGSTTISAGTLQLGSGGTTGSIVGNVLNDGAVLFDRSDDVGFAGVIRGVGTMTKLGTNTLTLTGNNSYTGTTTITGGVLQLGDGGSTGALVGNTVNDGGLTFNRSGSLSYAGAISGSGWVRQRGPGTTVLSGASSYTGGTFISAGTLSVSADQHLGDPSSAVSLNGGTLQLAASFSSARNLLIDTAGGTIDVTDRNELTGHIDGTGALIKSGSGALIVNTVANATGPIEVAAGTLVVGDSAHPSAQLAGNGDVNVAAGAFLGGYGQVVGRVNNAGTLGVGNALPALANDLDAQFTIVGPLVNMGSITMVNGAAVDQLIVSGNYVSSGGQLETEAVLNEGGQAAQSDRLVANTVSLAGSPTGIVVHNLGGTGAVTSGDGIALVNVLDASLSAAGAFVLAGRAVAGPYEYLLFQGGVANPSDGQWYLRSNFRPEVGAYLANRQNAADAMRQTLHDRQGDPQYSREGATDADSTLGKAWLRVQGGNVRSQAADGLLATQGRQSLIQLGGDFGSWTVFSETDRLHVGGMAGYADGRADIIAQFNPAQARGHAYGYFAGAYATWFANNDQRLGAYVDTWLQAGWFNNHVRSSMLPDVHYDSTHWAASIESGYGFAAGKNWVVEPQVQVIYNDYQADSLTDSTGTRVGSLNGSATIGRLGVRVYPQLMSSYYGRPFIEANWWNGGSTHAITFNGIPVSDAVPSNRYQLNVGLQMRTGEGWVIWGRLGGEWGSAQYERVNGQLGLKYSW